MNLALFQQPRVLQDTDNIDVGLTPFQRLLELQDTSNICSYTIFWKHTAWSKFDELINRISRGEQGKEYVTLQSCIDDTNRILDTNAQPDIFNLLDLIFHNLNADRPSIAISMLKVITSRCAAIRANLFVFRQMVERILLIVDPQSHSGPADLLSQHPRSPSGPATELTDIIDIRILRAQFDIIFGGIDDRYNIESPDEISLGKPCKLHGLYYDIDAQMFLNEIICYAMRPWPSDTPMPGTNEEIFDITFGDYMKAKEIGPDLLAYLDDILTKCLE